MVKLTFGSKLDGIINGNVAIPKVNNTQATVNDEVRNTNAFLLKLDSIIVRIGSIIPSSGTSHNIGKWLKFVNHDGDVDTVFSNGFDGPL